MSNASNAPSPSRLLGHLADSNRLRVLAAVVLRESRVAGIAEGTGLTEEEVARALGHLVSAGVVVQAADGLHADARVFADAARAASPPRVKPDLSDATPEQAAVLRNFVGGDGRVDALPARSARRRLVLEYLATRFEPSRDYGEREVNAVLEQVHDDYVTLRRYLVDEGLLERSAGVYRRPSSSPVLHPNHTA
jgi:hypothetical protein